MSTTKLDTSGIFQPLEVVGDKVKMTLSQHSVRIRKNGIEFSSLKSFPVWKEMSLDLVSPSNNGKVHCTGVVVACDGNRHMGYTVSMVFLSLSQQAQECLDQLALGRL
jgi:hypothetical protein